MQTFYLVLFLIQISNARSGLSDYQFPYFLYNGKSIYQNLTTVTVIVTSTTVSTTSISTAATQNIIPWVPKLLNPGRFCCPNNYKIVGRGCYKFFLNKGSARSWAQARTTCRQMKGYLVKIDNAFEQKYLIHRINGLLKYRGCTWKTQLFWTGGNDLDKEGTLKWLDGTIVGYNETATLLTIKSSILDAAKTLTYSDWLNVNSQGTNYDWSLAWKKRRRRRRKKRDGTFVYVKNHETGKEMSNNNPASFGYPDVSWNNVESIPKSVSESDAFSKSSYYWKLVRQNPWGKNYPGAAPSPALYNSGGSNSPWDSSKTGKFFYGPQQHPQQPTHYSEDLSLGKLPNPYWDIIPPIPPWQAGIIPDANSFHDQYNSFKSSQIDHHQLKHVATPATYKLLVPNTTPVPIPYPNWKNGRPCNDITRNCISINVRNKFTWVVNDCKMLNNFVCETTPIRCWITK